MRNNVQYIYYFVSMKQKKNLMMSYLQVRTNKEY